MKHPTAVVTDFKKCRLPAQIYVILSRAQRLSQVYIFDDLYPEKWTVGESALNELRNTEKNALNVNSMKEQGELIIVSLNIFSLPSKFNDVKQIVSTVKPDVLCIQETWLQPGVHHAAEFQLRDYEVHLISLGKGKGIATYFSKEFKVGKIVKQNDLQMTKVCSKKLDVINVYRSSKGRGLETHLSILNEGKALVVTGDMNIDMKKSGSEQKSLKSFLEEAQMKLMVDNSTHEKGGLLDHVYVSERLVKNTKVQQKGIRFSDHDLLVVRIKENP